MDDHDDESDDAWSQIVIGNILSCITANLEI